MCRAKEPRSPKAREAVRLFRSGATINQVAAALWITPQSAEKFWLRWIVLPEWESAGEAQGKEIQRLNKEIDRLKGELLLAYSRARAG